MQIMEEEEQFEQYLKDKRHNDMISAINSLSESLRVYSEAIFTAYEKKSEELGEKIVGIKMPEISIDFTELVSSIDEIKDKMVETDKNWEFKIIRDSRDKIQKVIAKQI